VSAKELLTWIKTPKPLQSSYDNNSTNDPPSTKFPLGAGFRCSIYGQRPDPGPKYWAGVAQQMSARFPGATPEAIWIVGRKTDRGVQLPFPVGNVGDPLITGSNEVDAGEAALKLFDELGFRIWLQVEPRFASVDKLLNLVLKQYSHHSC